MSFKIHKRYAHDSNIVTVVIDNSDVIGVGALVQLRNGNVKISTAGAASAGVVIGFVDKNGKGYETSTASKGTSTSTGSGQGLVVTVASDNETVDLIAAQIETSKKMIYSAGVTGTMNTTTASNKIGGWVNAVFASNNSNVDETTHSRTITDVRTLKNWGVDPNDTSRMLVSINHSELYDNGAAMA